MAATSIRIEGAPRLPDLRRPSTARLVGRAVAYWFAQYRRTWRGTAVSSVLSPVAFLASMGLGLGSLIDRGVGDGGLGGLDYLHFVAPALLAATAMQTAGFECTYPVMGAVKWNRQYHAMLATPLRVVDVLAGHLLFVLFRFATTLAALLAVEWAFGAVASPWALLAVPAAVLTGLAYATPILAFAVRQETDGGFAMLWRFGIVPMFLFSGTFFPIHQLPELLQPVAWAVPLWHGVELCRASFAGGMPALTAVGHVAYLLAWAVAGFLLARRGYQRRLEV